MGVMLVALLFFVALAGFAVGGAFLSLVYYDVPYYLMAAVVAMRQLLAHQQARASLKPVAA